MKCFIAALSALLAVASAVPIYDVIPSMTAGPLGGYGDVMDVYKTMKYMSSDLTGIRGAYNPMYMLWAGFGGVSSSDMGLYGPYSSLYRHYGLMGIGNDWDLHQSIKMNWYPDVWNYGVHGSGLVGDMYSRELMDKVLYKPVWNTVDKMVCYHRYGIERCHLMMMHKMMPHMMMSHMIY